MTQFFETFKHDSINVQNRKAKTSSPFVALFRKVTLNKHSRMTPISHYFVHRLIKTLAFVAAFFTHAHLSLGEYGAAQAACTDNDPIISGKSLVCANEQTNYTTPLVANTTFTWVLASGGQIVSTANNNVTIKWNNQPSSGPHKLTVTQTNINGCIKTTN